MGWVNADIIELSRTTIFSYEDCEWVFHCLRIKPPFGYGLDAADALTVLKGASGLAPKFNRTLGWAAAQIAWVTESEGRK